MRIGGFVIVLQSLLNFSFHLFCDAKIVEGKDVLRISFQRVLKDRIGLDGASLRQQPYSLDVGMVDFNGSAWADNRLLQRCALDAAGTGLIDRGVAQLL